MKFPFSNTPVDELLPLRELRSPLTTSAIREQVLERMAAPSLWGQFRNILAEFLVVGVAGAALLKMAGPVELHYTSQATHPANRTHWTAWTNGTDGTNNIVKSRGVRANRIVPSEKPVNAIIPDESPSFFSNNTLRTDPIALANGIDHVYPILDTQYPAPNMVGDADIHSPIWFASASGGAIFSQIRMMGERGELGFEDGWKTVALSFTSGEGSRDLRDEIAHHSGLTAPLLSKERNQEFSLLFGATAQAGPIELRAMAGPAYLSSSSTYYSFSTGITGTPVSLQSFGAAAEISALYPVNSSFAAGIDGMANYHSRQFNGGVFASIEYRFAQ